jgi:hypothetical protein
MREAVDRYPANAFEVTIFVRPSPANVVQSRQHHLMNRPGPRSIKPGRE